MLWYRVTFKNGYYLLRYNVLAYSPTKAAESIGNNPLHNDRGERFDVYQCVSAYKLKKQPCGPHGVGEGFRYFVSQKVVY